jgi:hypothetical protein
MTKFTLVSAVLLVAFAGLAQANSASANPDEPLWEPPIVDWSTQLPQPSMPDPIISSFEVANIHIVLDETPMADVQAKLTMETGHKGDAAESLRWLCFHGEDKNGGWMFWLQSGEIHGGAVGGFQWRRIDIGARVDRRCRRLMANQIQLPIALRLGMNATELRRLLGVPSGRTENSLEFHHEHREQMEEGIFTVSNYATVLLTNGTVSAIEVWQYAVN